MSPAFATAARRALLACSIAAPALAQSPSTARDTARLGPMLVTATKSELAPSVAAAVVLQGEALRARGVATVGDALREVAGVHVAQNGSAGATASLFVRGGQSNYLKVLVDGVSVNEAGGFVDAANLTTDAVDRIEIVRGASSVLYGSDAVSGVVQIFTRRPTNGLRLEAAVRGGSTARKVGRNDAALRADGHAGALDATVDASGGDARLGWTLGVGRHQHDGVLAFNNAWRNTTAAAALSAAPDARTGLRVTARLIDASYQYPTDGAGLAVDSNAVRDERRVVLGLEADRRLGARARLRMLAAAHEFDGVSSDQPDSPGDSSGYYYRTENDNFRRTLETRLELQASDAAIVTLGAEGQWQGEVSHGTSRFAAYENAPTTFDERRRNVGWFAQAAGIARAVTYSLGARVDDNQKFGTFGTWRGGVAVAAPGAVRLRASVGTAFKEPSFIEVFNTGYTRGNAALRPEHARSWELGADRRIGSLTVGATWFDQRFRDMIQYRAQPETSQDPHYFNIARATARGLELEARTDEHRPLFAAASVTALRTRVVDAGFQNAASDNFVVGHRLLRRPDRQVSLTLGWRPTPAARLAATGVHVGARDDRDFANFPADPVVLDAYTKLDLSGEIDLPPRRAAAPYSLTVRVENALNTSYEDIRNFAAPGRTIFVGIRARLAR